MRDGRAYLSFLSDFWTSLWSDSNTLASLLGVEAEILNRLYLQAVRTAAPAFIDTLPLFREDFWHLIYFQSDGKQADGFKYELPRDYHEIPFLFNKVFEPTVILRAGTDYTLETMEGRTYLVFDHDPFLDPAMPIRDRGDVRQILFFAPKVYTDEQDLYKLFGYLTGIVRPTSEQYRQLVRGVLFLYANGPVLFALNAGLSLAVGYPISRDFDVVTAIGSDGISHLIDTQKGHRYEIPGAATLSVVVGSALRPLSTFIDDIRIIDYLSDPEWWRGGPDEQDLEKRMVKYLPPDLVPEMNDYLRADPETIDYLFDEYLKYSILGVKYNPQAIGDFQAIDEFFGVLYDVKMHWTAPYVVRYFGVSDLFPPPEDLAEIVATLDLTHLVAEDPTYDSAEYVRRKAGRVLGGGCKVGLSDLRDMQAFCYERAELDVGIEPQEEIRVDGGPWILGGRRRIGFRPLLCVGERVEVKLLLELDDTVDLSGVQEAVHITVGEPDAWFDGAWFGPAGFGGPPPP